MSYTMRIRTSMSDTWSTINGSKAGRPISTKNMAYKSMDFLITLLTSAL